jgi:hypothetical protein
VSTGPQADFPTIPVEKPDLGAPPGIIELHDRDLAKGTFFLKYPCLWQKIRRQWAGFS